MNALTLALLLIATFAAFLGLIIWGLLQRGDPFGGDLAIPEGEPEEWTGPLHGGTRFGRKLTAEFRSRGLMLPPTVSKATRKLAAALESTRRVSWPRRALRAVRQAYRDFVTALEVSHAVVAPYEGKHAAGRPIPEPPLEPLPEGEPGAADMSGPAPGPAYSWQTGEFARVIEWGD